MKEPLSARLLIPAAILGALSMIVVGVTTHTAWGLLGLIPVFVVLIWSTVEQNREYKDL